MKKLSSIIFILTLVLVLFVGCGNNKEKNVSSSNETTSTTSKKENKNPTPEEIKSSISKIDGILEIEIVTEDNDPNGQLGKQGGYTGALFFTYNLVNQDELDDVSAIEKGTNGGGCVEIYANKLDANKRNDYLSTFDGSAFSSGSHIVLNTFVIRTSNLLKASEQKALEEKLIKALS